MSYEKRHSLLVVLDMAIVWFSILTAYVLRFDGSIPSSFIRQALIYGAVSCVICFLTMRYFKLYNRVWQYASIGEILAIFKSVTVGVLLSFTVTYAITLERVPLSILLRHYETLLLFVGGSRFVWRIVRDKFLIKKPARQKSALIFGAGDCGALIAKEMLSQLDADLYPVAFIDDDRLKHKQRIHDLPVLGSRKQLATIVSSMHIDEIIIAIPSLSKKAIAEIIEVCKGTKAKLRIIPNLNDLINGKVTVRQIRDVEVEDLLGRDPIKVDLEGIANYVENKTVLVTGAGGSIGSELCRQIAPFQPSRLILLGHGENSIYNIEMEMRRKYPLVPIETVIADIQDRERIDEVFQMYRPEVVFHAAAHKHVPLMERNPAEAIKNNVFGTKNVAEAADRYGSERFVLISTDKAVNPTSIMGTTKRIAEMIVQSLGRTSKTKFVAVRFGNVLGSRGSVIPHFKRQIALGGPVTVTHPDMIRYFMTIPEAVQLVIQAGAFAKGGEIFILDMGEPVRIVQLAEDLIRLSGFVPYEDIDIEFSGIRPGEKLYEELLTDEEGIGSTTHDRIFIGKPTLVNQAQFELELKMLEKSLSGDRTEIRESLKSMVPTFLNVS
ncbi:NDP-sugar epimerase, includes UDP-GlcNAc-inverting 4,6-dehydratase FlaA1 and capsular polysaccharide biosynthesis protein EpsC [Paenibacillus sp. UNCCL117]|uniref:polysaccharide biosynthesis protein n=1 Tax=unclassified Paenibacillus TaxID=185978 RepID=UPI00088579A0|nr:MULTISPECIES: nucleoside-diphosphate sugar epimerase/dehydratase [unclassified Paenibacillus]SDC04073.1 NDP-sugar epimerase, includes UDP-GlcNAc-inverting 4,6-dehydratase FlaA1 and capsular polysaccharide biosynthesis protein EpsC [Paenibacillus sp. cl123]SFW37242.1 NDP-sugar epimerase, includes UDP-GlcNAc-inverting 4,6-dehydratase FlaA1 and capsular polysaccharide biosynthesis protein EpsC [Paenibacillus sp. UNCCL117]